MIVLVSCIAANAVEVIPYDKILDDIFANEIKARKSALWEMLMGVHSESRECCHRAAVW